MTTMVLRQNQPMQAACFMFSSIEALVKDGRAMTRDGE